MGVFLPFAVLAAIAAFASAEMSRPAPTFRLPLSISLPQMVGITAPAIYSSLTFAYSHMVVPPLVAHAPEKLLARQWLQAYQYAANFVPPLVISGTLSNLYLAYYAPTTGSKLQYISAAVLVFSIIPWTLLGFEPSINGAGKWKVQTLLREEGYVMPVQQGRLPSPFEHTATPEAKQWAESTSMKAIASEWARLNARRYMVTASAMALSISATCTWLLGPLPCT